MISLNFKRIDLCIKLNVRVLKNLYVGYVLIFQFF